MTLPGRSNLITVLRTASFRDDDMVYRLPPASRSANEIWPSDQICKESQRAPNQTADSPRLVVKAGDAIVLLYQENGHVTKIDDDPGHPSSGTVLVFGTSYPSSADTFQGVMDPSENSSRPILLHSSEFDDGVCYQENGTPKALERKALNYRPHLEIEKADLWCGIGVRLPANIQSGTVYTLYWVWMFDGIGFIERYTTCIDVDIV